MAHPTRLTVEYSDTFQVLGTRRPRFSWEVPLPGRGRRQTAYRLRVATTPDLARDGSADLWDSGKVDSSRSAHVEYAGRTLPSNVDCFWSVEVWDETGASAGQSRVEHFATAFFDESDWCAKWIGLCDPTEPMIDPQLFAEDRLPTTIKSLEPERRSPQLRKSFRLDQRVRRARVFVCGVGLFELRLNGAKVGHDVLATPRTEFRKRLLYSVYDVTSQLLSGQNTLGVVLGNGWYNGSKKYWKWQMQWYGSPRAIVQLEIEFVDGSKSRVISDETWRGAWSPITDNCIYDGESYDAQLEQPGWDAPGFADDVWRPVNVVPSPGGKLEPVPHQQNRVTDVFGPAAIAEPSPGVFVYDFGRNMTGWTRLRLRGAPAGTVVKLRYAEAIHAGGSLDPSTAGEACQTDTYVARGIGDETFEPRFTYHGFQYVELTGYPGTPDLHTLEACFVRTAVETTGAFECAHPLINRIHACTVQSQKCNIQMGVPTDDTQRAERLGWAADVWSYAVEAFYNFNAAPVFAKWIGDFFDQQDETGLVGFIVPHAGLEEDLVWSAAMILVPWWQYLHCGDRRLLEQSYPYLKRYMDYLHRTGQREVRSATPEQVKRALRFDCSAEDRVPKPEDHGYLQISRFGDHLATSEGASGFSRNQPLSIATAFYYLDAITMARIADVLGEANDATYYRGLSDKIRDAFNARFLDANSAYYDVGSQNAQAWPLAFGMVPPEHHARVASYFCSSVNFRQQRLTTGYAGTKWAIHALAQSGRADIIWARAVATEYPSWGYMLRDPNRTTITENWMGKASLCHTALGAAIDEWFYWGLAGISPDERGPGYERVIIKPWIPRELAWARAAIDTPRGRIASAWEHDGRHAELHVTIPANTTATVHLPADASQPITESGAVINRPSGIERVDPTDADVALEIGSGEYTFSFALI